MGGVLLRSVDKHKLGVGRVGDEEKEQYRHLFVEDRRRDKETGKETGLPNYWSPEKLNVHGAVDRFLRQFRDTVEEDTALVAPRKMESTSLLDAERNEVALKSHLGFLQRLAKCLGGSQIGNPLEKSAGWCKKRL